MPQKLNIHEISAYKESWIHVDYDLERNMLPTLPRIIVYKEFYLLSDYGAEIRLFRDLKKIIDRIDDVLNEADNEINQLKNYSSKQFDGRSLFALDFPETYIRLCSRIYTTIYDLTPHGSAYRHLAIPFSKDFNFKSVVSLRSILRNIKSDYEKGYFDTVEQVINSETFTDILEQSAYFLSQGWLRASAVIAGVAIESHIRKLAENNDIPTEKDGNYEKAETLNQLLRTNRVYDLNMQKSITAWLGVRNTAAHYDNKRVDKASVELMIEGIRNLISRYPA